VPPAVYRWVDLAQPKSYQDAANRGASVGGLPDVAPDRVVFRRLADHNPIERTNGDLCFS